MKTSFGTKLTVNQTPRFVPYGVLGKHETLCVSKETNDKNNKIHNQSCPPLVPSQLVPDGDTDKHNLLLPVRDIFCAG